MNIDKNVEYLTANPFHWVAESKEGINYPKFIAKKDLVEYFEQENGEVSVVGDICDPSLKHNKFRKELIIILGVNSINEIKEIYKFKNKDSFVVVLEPRLTLFEHVLNNKNMSIFKNKDIALFVDDQLENITTFLEPLLANLAIVGLAKNLRFYVTDYYRNYDIEISKELLRFFRQGVHSRIEILGNSVQDSLQGLEQYLDNIPWIMRSKNPETLKNKFQNTPAIVVAAGPSLNKNIEELKVAQNKAIIIAVDTIIKRLIDEGITPHFVCSIERISQVYDYFFKDTEYPQETTLVAPPLLDSRVFNSFKGEMILPFRMEVSEFRWLQRALGLSGDIGMLMGLSCANVAFGLAYHLGCSPIIFAGQDLAYGATEEETHASGTTYDNMEKKPKDTSNDEITEGYYGGSVKTTKIWLQFKHWFESQIQKYNLHVINATEGGAKIYHTEQLSLKNVINKYCNSALPNIYSKIKEASNYCINPQTVKENLLKDKAYIEDLLEKCVIQEKDLSDLKINAETFNKNRIKIQNIFYRINYIKQQILNHQLILHDLQALLLQYYWDSNSVEQFINVANLEFERNSQLKLIIPTIVTLAKILDEFEDTIEELDQMVEV